MKSILGLAGKLLFAVPLIAFSLMHLTQSGMLAEKVLAGWPMAQFLVIVSGLGLLAGAVSILTGKYTGIGATLLGVELLIFIVTIGVPHMLNAADEGTKMMVMAQNLKETMLVGAAFIIASAAGFTKSS